MVPSGPLRVRGVVQRVIPDRGFGFIRALNGAPGDYFFYRASLEGLVFEEVREGLLVEFEPTQVARGPRAEHVCRAEAEG